MTESRLALLRRFAETHVDAAEYVPLAGDASFRRYFRLHQPAGQPFDTMVVMDAPPPREDVRPFVRIATHLSQVGLKVPGILAADIENGFLLLDDFGDDTFPSLLDRGENPRPLFEMAIDALVHLHNHPAMNKIDVPAYDTDMLIAEMSLTMPWLYRVLNGQNPSETLEAEFAGIWRDVFATMPAPEIGLVMRDYHSPNLMRLRDGTLGVLDFQDSLLGPVAYDVMSLLEDPRRDTDADLATAMLARYCAARPGHSTGADFMAWFEVLSAQRAARISALWLRLALRDGKHGYLNHYPRTIAMLEKRLALPRMASVKAWYDTHMPNRLNPLPDLHKITACTA